VCCYWLSTDLLFIPRQTVNDIKLENSFHGDTGHRYVNVQADAVERTHLNSYEAPDKNYTDTRNLNERDHPGTSSRRTIIPDDEESSRRRSAGRRVIHEYDNVAFSWSKKRAANDYADPFDVEHATTAGESKSAAIINVETCSTLQPKQSLGGRTVDSELVERRQRPPHDGETRRATTSRSSAAVSEVDPDELGKIFDGVIELANEHEKARLEDDMENRSNARGKETVSSSSSSNKPHQRQASSPSATDKSETKSIDEGYNTKRNTMDEPTTAEVTNEMAEMLVSTAAAEGRLVTYQTEREVTMTESRAGQVNGRRPTRVWPPVPEVSTVTVDSAKQSQRIAPIPRTRKSSDNEQTTKTTTPVAAPRPTVRPKPPVVHLPSNTAAVESRLDKSTPPSSAGGVTDTQSIALLSENITFMSAIELGRCAVEELEINRVEVDRMVSAGFDGRQLVSTTPEQLMKRFQMTPFNANKLIRFARGWRPTK